MENLKMPYSEVKHTLVIIGQNNDFQIVFSFEKINFCTIVGRWISLKAERSKGSDNFCQRGISSFCSSTYTL